MAAVSLSSQLTQIGSWPIQWVFDSLLPLKLITSVQIQDQIDPSRLFSTGERPLPLSQLQSDLMEHRDGFAIAFVVGSEMAGRCVLLMDTSQEHHTFYYVLPYKTVG